MSKSKLNTNLKHKTMTKKLTKLYVVAKDSELLFTDAVYDFKTAESVCSIAKEQGYKDAKVITVAYAIKAGYDF